MYSLYVFLNIFKTQKQNLSKNGFNPEKKGAAVFFKAL
jgi:hypothetical protein